MKQVKKYYISPYLLYLSRLLNEHFRKTLKKEGLFAGQHTLMMYVNDHPGCTQNELAKGAAVSFATVSVSLKRLEKSGFIDRQERRGDARAHAIFLTPQGQEAMENIFRALLNAETALVQGMTAEEIDLFRSFLKRSIQNLGGEVFPQEALPPPGRNIL